MIIISILNQKGGCGKTTIATNLAVAMSREFKVLLVDGNPQQASASDWYEAGGSEFVDSISVDKPSMIKGLKNVGAGYDYVIVDTSPAKNESAAACISISDLVLIPVQPSPYDLWACADLVSLIKQRQEINDGQPKSLFIINAVKQGTTSFTEIMETIEEYGIKKMKSVLCRREVYIKTASIGSSVILSSDSKAKSEFEGLYQEIKGLLL
jgi:chromosome partitioning protein